jgi:aspartate 1-decarboxylase
MFVKALKGKIHRATVTGVKVDYPGSVAVDPVLLEAAGIAPYEEVLLANVTNGKRVETYVIPAETGSGDLVVLGAAGRLFNVNDIVIVMNFAYYTPEEVKSIKPKVIVADKNNKIKDGL